MNNIDKPVHFLATQCKAIREFYGITQYKLAEWIDTNQTEISFMERGFIPEDYSKIESIETLYKQTLHKK